MSTANEQILRMKSRYGDDWARFAERWTKYALRTAPIEPGVLGP
jgi:hypothetical protein